MYLRIIFLFVFAVSGFACATPSALNPKTIDDAICQLKPAVGRSLQKKFRRAKVNYPPAELAFLGFKQERKLEMWARNAGQKWKKIDTYPVLGASGVAGPKLKEGDKQVPEGVYHLSMINPCSSYHLSIQVGYPNDYDISMAREDGRRGLGGDIFIHGNKGSRGCLAVGDKNIEPIFLAAARTGKENVTVILAPNDLRKRPPVYSAKSREIRWLPELYARIEHALQDFK